MQDATCTDAIRQVRADQFRMSPEATCTHSPVVAAFSSEDEDGAEAAADVDGDAPDEAEVDEYVVPLVQSVPMTTVTSE